MRLTEDPIAPDVGAGLGIDNTSPDHLREVVAHATSC